MTATAIAPIVANSSVRMAQPFAALAVVNGITLAVRDYTISLNAHGVLDTAEFTVPMLGNPDFTKALFQGESDTSAVQATIYAGYPTTPAVGAALIPQLTKRFVGQLDQYVIHHAQGTVLFELRSLGAKLTDEQRTTPISAATSLDFIIAQASQAGLAVKSALVGSPIPMAEVFARTFVAGVKNFRVWDLITRCALYDDVDVWVDGSTLYYMAPSLIPRTTVPLVIGRDLATASITHSQQYNRKIRVEVRTYSPRHRQSSVTRIETLANGTVVVKHVSRYSTSSPVFGTTGVVTTTYANNGTTSSSSSGSSSSTGGGFSATASAASVSGIERYIIYKAGLTPQACDNLARAIWRRISMHEWAASLTLPLRPDLIGSVSRTSLIALSGSPYSLINQTYWPRRITETAHLNSGVSWAIEAVNHQLPLGAV